MGGVPNKKLSMAGVGALDEAVSGCAPAVGAEQALQQVILLGADGVTGHQDNAVGHDVLQWPP